MKSLESIASHEIVNIKTKASEDDHQEFYHRKKGLLKEISKNTLPPKPKRTKRKKGKQNEASSLNPVKIEKDPAKIEEQKLKFRCMSQ